MFIGLFSFCTIRTFDESLAINSKGPIICIYLNDKPCQTRPTLINTNFNKTLFYLFIVSVDKCGGSCNTIDHSYAQVCVP